MKQEELKAWLSRVSTLSLIRVSKSEESKFIEDLRRILEFFDSVSKLEGLESVVEFEVRELQLDLNDLREDVPERGASPEELLRSTQLEKGYVKGPRTV